MQAAERKPDEAGMSIETWVCVGWLVGGAHGDARRPGGEGRGAGSADDAGSVPIVHVQRPALSKKPPSAQRDTRWAAGESEQ